MIIPARRRAGGAQSRGNRLHEAFIPESSGSWRRSGAPRKRRDRSRWQSRRDWCLMLAATTRHLLYGRHFALLICGAVCVLVLGLLHLTGGLFSSFALYGALHATAFVAALRPSQSIRRRCLFIAMAAIFSAATLCLGIYSRPLFAAFPGNFGLYAALGFSSLTGAAIYAILIRLFWMPKLPPVSIAAISLGCMLISLAALFAVSRIQTLAGWWLALPWWFAFSSGLWYFDGRRHSVSRNLVGYP